MVNRKLSPHLATAALAACALLSTGCRMGPDYQRPKVEPPAVHRGQASAEAKSSGTPPSRT